MPGTDRAITSPDDAVAFVEEYGLPVMIKAAKGGGGKGMRVVRRQEDLIPFFKSASSEALAAFGDGGCFVERYVGAAKHMEVSKSETRSVVSVCEYKHHFDISISVLFLTYSLSLWIGSLVHILPHTTGSSHWRWQGQRRPSMGARLLSPAPPSKDYRDCARVALSYGGSSGCARRCPQTHQGLQLQERRDR